MKKTKIHRSVDNLVSDFCKIILTQEDNLDYNQAENYIKSLTSEEKQTLNSSDAEERQIHLVVFDAVIQYIKSFNSSKTNASISSSIFEFDSGGNYIEYRIFFENTYQKRNNGAPLPSALKIAFDYVQEICDHYRIFGYFYNVRSKETSDRILSDMEMMATTQAEQAVEKATTKKAQKEVTNALEAKMKEVNSSISETSVTILGIFAGIVLTVVAGLFYSSSVLESINTANFYRLLCVASLVGLICLHLIALMFRYIAKIGSRDVGSPFSNTSALIVSIFLVVLIGIGLVCQHYFPATNTSSSNSGETNINVNWTVPSSDDSQSEDNSADSDDLVDKNDETNK